MGRKDVLALVLLGFSLSIIVDESTDRGSRRPTTGSSYGSITTQKVWVKKITRQIPLDLPHTILRSSRPCPRNNSWESLLKLIIIITNSILQEERVASMFYLLLKLLSIPMERESLWSNWWMYNRYNCNIPMNLACRMILTFSLWPRDGMIEWCLNQVRLVQDPSWLK